MKKFFLSLWYDESRFIGVCRALIVVVGQLFNEGIIQTGVDGAGAKIGAFLLAIAVAVPAGQRNSEK